MGFHPIQTNGYRHTLSYSERKTSQLEGEERSKSCPGTLFSCPGTLCCRMILGLCSAADIVEYASQVCTSNLKGRVGNPNRVSGFHARGSLHLHSERIQCAVQTVCHSLFYSLLHLRHTQLPLLSSPLSSLLFSFPLIFGSPLLYFHVTLISLSAGLLLHPCACCLLGAHDLIA